MRWGLLVYYLFRRCSLCLDILTILPPGVEQIDYVDQISSLSRRVRLLRLRETVSYVWGRQQRNVYVFFCSAGWFRLFALHVCSRVCLLYCNKGGAAHLLSSPVGQDFRLQS